MNICQNKRNVFLCTWCILCINRTWGPPGLCCVLCCILLPSPFSLGKWTFSKGEKTFFTFKRGRRGQKPIPWAWRMGRKLVPALQSCGSITGPKFQKQHELIALKIEDEMLKPLPAVQHSSDGTCKHSSWGTLRSWLPFANLGKFLTHLHQIWNHLYTICSCALTSPLWRKLHGSFSLFPTLKWSKLLD